ncbi:hypothetical protein QOZ80_2BG0163200 [Eleusine coracana subsp. coracana]|nr:hypothetical protein QOZ80_2BG0163200 [Eleusine coracana subsp. coracana]
MKARNVATLLLVTISFQVLAGIVAQLETSPSPAPEPAPEAKAPMPPPLLPAIFVFGDGALDVGNNNDLPEGDEMGDAPRATRPYYGIDSPNSQPTGRFSNGYNIADFIAKALGFAMSPPAYASLPVPSPTTMQRFTGVNYASAYAGLRESTNAQMTISLSDQVKNFAATRSQLEALLGGREPLNNLLSESLFLIGVGTMDLLPCCNFYLTFPLKDNKTEVQRLIELYESTLATLHGMGARKFGVINVGPLGRLPSVHMSRHSEDPSIDRRATEFNAKLGLLLSNLTTKLNGFRYSFADFYGFTNATFANPSGFGFLNTKYACCTDPCSPDMYVAPCDSRSEYWFWDNWYTTEKASKLAAAAFCSGNAFAMPVNIKELAAMKGSMRDREL